MKNVSLYLKIVSLRVIVVGFVGFGHANLLYLDEGDKCPGIGDRNSTDHVCKLPENCPTLEQDIRRQNFPRLCTFVGNKPVVCCPTVKNDNVTLGPISSTTKPTVVSSYSAAEMCRQYSELAYTNVKLPWSTTNEHKKMLDCYNVLPLILGGTGVQPKEFPHMALLGYGSQEGGREKSWSCGGSLISNRWIMSAAHCAVNSEKTLSWALLGDLNIYSESDNAKPKEYEIVQQVVHPAYNPSYVYNDIALFRLGSDVQFSAHVRPVCLNTDQKLNFRTASAAGWGRTGINGPTSPDLLKVNLKQMDVSKCKYSYPPSLYPRINLGILEESMICAGDFKDGNYDTCTGDSGGPLQVPNTDYPCMYYQIGITSFGKYCGSKDTPGVYTRVSYYVPWIEQIVWPKS